MTIALNGKLRDSRSPVLSINDRAFLYGDGIFETIICYGGKPRFWQDHHARAWSGAHALGIESGFPTSDTTKAVIKALLDRAELSSGWAKVRWVIWRKEGGLYTPTSGECNWSLEAFSFTPKPLNPAKVGLAKTASVSQNALSHTKTLGATTYVLAGIEKKRRQLDDLLILGERGNIAEAISSNILIGQGETIITPSDKSGCVAGVMRTQILKKCQSRGIKTVFGGIDIKGLLSAEWTVLSNTSGFSYISDIEGKMMGAPPPLVVSIIEELIYQLP